MRAMTRRSLASVLKIENNEVKPITTWDERLPQDAYSEYFAKRVLEGRKPLSRKAFDYIMEQGGGLDSKL